MQIFYKDFFFYTVYALFHLKTDHRLISLKSLNCYTTYVLYSVHSTVRVYQK